MQITENAINMISEGTRLEGKISFDQVTRVNGVLHGDVKSLPGSTLILGETGLIEGNVEGDVVIVDGFVKGDIRAKTRVALASSGRVIGNIETPSLTIEFGAYFEGKCSMEKAPTKANQPKPA